MPQISHSTTGRSPTSQYEFYRRIPPLNRRSTSPLLDDGQAQALAKNRRIAPVLGQKCSNIVDYYGLETVLGSHYIPLLSQNVSLEK
jgi:hypothetical protein